ncbi:MAG: hypothetical protein IT377_06975 [Polyangiaceae bacterium]|nr:hypothetical protein [Polyangiaceae bacterium]
MKRLVCLLLPLAFGCGPRSLWTQLEHPYLYERTRGDDARVEQLFAQRAQAIAATEPGPVLRFAQTLTEAVGPSSLARRRVDIGEPLEVDALIADASAALDRVATQASPKDAAALLLAKGRLLMAAGAKQPAKEAFLAALAADPGLDAFLALVPDLDDEQTAPQVRERACAGAKAAVDREMAAATTSEVQVLAPRVAEAVSCCGLGEANGCYVLELKGLRFAEWVPKRARELTRCEASHRGCLAAIADERSTLYRYPRSFCDIELGQCGKAALEQR